MLKLKYIAMFDSNHKSFKDMRKREAWIVCSYFDENGDEYRRSFSFPRGTSEIEARKLVPDTLKS